MPVLSRAPLLPRAYEWTRAPQAERTESYFYHAIDDGWLHQPWLKDGGKRPGAGYPSYPEWLKRSLAQARECKKRGVARPWPDCDTWGLFVSFYAEQLRQWLRYFRAEQFIVIPFGRYLGDNRRVMADLAQRLGMDLTPGPTSPVSANTRKTRKRQVDIAMTSALHKFFVKPNNDLTMFIREKHLHVSPDGSIPPQVSFFDLARRKGRRQSGHGRALREVLLRYMQAARAGASSVQENTTSGLSPSSMVAPASPASRIQLHRAAGGGHHADALSLR